MHGFPDILFVSGTDIQGGQGIHTACKPDQDAGKQRHKDTGGTNCPKGNGACKFSHYSYVRHVKNDLQYIGKHQRNTVK